MSPPRRPGAPGDRASGEGGHGDRALPLPYRVTRWTKFWSLEPLFADTRSYLIAKGGAPPRLDDLVLAVPVHGDRRRIVEVLGGAGDLKAVLRALHELVAEGINPRLVISHGGMGLGLFVKDFLPNAVHIGFFEWYFRPATARWLMPSYELDQQLLTRMRNLPTRLR